MAKASAKGGEPWDLPKVIEQLHAEEKTHWGKLRKDLSIRDAVFVWDDVEKSYADCRSQIKFQFDSPAIKAFKEKITNILVSSTRVEATYFS